MRLKFKIFKASAIKVHLVVLMLYTIITIILTYPLIFHMNNSLPPGDPAFNTWVLAWNVHSLTTDPLNYFNSNIFYPFLKLFGFFRASFCQHDNCFSDNPDIQQPHFGI